MLNLTGASIFFRTHRSVCVSHHRQTLITGLMKQNCKLKWNQQCSVIHCIEKAPEWKWLLPPGGVSTPPGQWELVAHWTEPFLLCCCCLTPPLEPSSGQFIGAAHRDLIGSGKANLSFCLENIELKIFLSSVRWAGSMQRSTPTKWLKRTRKTSAGQKERRADL